MEEELKEELNDLVKEMYSQDDETMYWGRKLLEILRKHKIGD